MCIHKEHKTPKHPNIQTPKLQKLPCSLTHMRTNNLLSVHSIPLHREIAEEDRDPAVLGVHKAVGERVDRNNGRLEIQRGPRNTVFPSKMVANACGK